MNIVEGSGIWRKCKKMGIRKFIKFSSFGVFVGKTYSPDSFGNSLWRIFASMLIGKATPTVISKLRILECMSSDMPL
jgi:hypothetical protein